MKQIGVIASILLAGAELAFGQMPPIGTAKEILKPRSFPGWQSQNVCCPFVFEEADGSYKMYYSGSGSEQWNESNWDQWVSGYVTSADTLTWKFPANYEQVLFARRLMEGDLLDPAETATVFDSIFAIAPCIIRTGSTYQMWYTGWNGETVHKGGGLTDPIHFRIGYATSTDGIRWNKVNGGGDHHEVLGLGSGNEFDAKGAACPYVRKDDGQYRMWYEGYDGDHRRILYATSPDGVAWTKAGLVLDRGGNNAKDELGLANPMVIRRNNRYELWYQGRSQSAPNYHILRAVSDDGTTWTKLPGEIVLHPQPALSGSERITVDSALVQSDGKVQVFFARERIEPRSADFWTEYVSESTRGTEPAGHNRTCSIYTEVVNPTP